jgi:glycosyltransferase involved in cell wall biosynthesis
MRICVLVHNDVSADGRVIRQADALAAGGHDVTVLGVCNPGGVAAPSRPERHRWELQLYRRDRRSARGKYNWFATALRSHIALLAARTLTSPAVGAHAVVRGLPELSRMAAATRPDLVVANDLTTLPVAARVGRKLGVPFIYDAHDLYTDEDVDKASFWSPIIAAVERHYIADAAAVLTASSGYAEALRQLYGVRPTVIHNVPPLSWSGADQRSVDSRGDGRVRLLHQGFLGFGSRGLEDLLAAFPMLPDHVELHVRGFITPDATAALQALGRQYPERIVIHPVVTPWQLLVEGRKCDIGLLMTKPTSRSNVLSVPNKLFEYFHSGLAVVASALPGPAAILGETDAGLVYQPGDADGLRDAITLLSTDPEQLATRRANAYAAARGPFNWEQESLKLVGVVERVAHGELRADPSRTSSRAAASELREDTTAARGTFR